MALQPVPESLRGALERCLHDLQQPTEVPLETGVDEDGEYLWFRESDGSASGFELRFHTGPGEETVERLAAFLQDQVFPETGEAWGEARPRCPGHRHPLRSDVVDGRAWWLCPQTGRPVCPIGTYVLD